MWVHINFAVLFFPILILPHSITPRKETGSSNSKLKGLNKITIKIYIWVSKWVTDSDKLHVLILQVHGNMSKASNDFLSERTRECFDLSILTFPFSMLTSTFKHWWSASFNKCRWNKLCSVFIISQAAKRWVMITFLILWINWFGFHYNFNLQFLILHSLLLSLFPVYVLHKKMCVHSSSPEVSKYTELLIISNESHAYQDQRNCQIY